MSTRVAQLLVVICLALGATGALAQDLAAKLGEAESLATRGKTAAAIDAYRALLDEGVDSQALHYNLGTLYLEEGELGRGVVHLKAALARAPDDADAAHNLDVALSTRTDQLVGVGPGLSVIEQLGRGIAPTQARLAALAPWLLLMLTLAAAPWLPTRLRRLRAVVVATMCVLSLAGGGVLYARMQVEAQTLFVVVAEQTPALKGPSNDAAMNFEAHAGLFGTEQGSQAGYVRLRLDNGLEAWFSLDDVTRVP